MSALPNFRNVKVSGLTGSGFASIYTDFRDNQGRGDNDFILGKTSSGGTLFSRTYLVGGYRKIWAEGGNGHFRFSPHLFSQSIVLPMSTSVNGVGTVAGFQSGDKRPLSAPVAPSNAADPSNGGLP
jgi:hypothetical protein